MAGAEVADSTMPASAEAEARRLGSDPGAMLDAAAECTCWRHAIPTSKATGVCVGYKYHGGCSL